VIRATCRSPAGSFDTAKLFAVPAAIMPGGSTAPLGSLPGIAGVLGTFGGVLLLLGLFTRPVAFLLSGEMAVAYFYGHAPHAFWPVLNQGTDAALYAFLWLYTSAVGPGPWSNRRAAPACRSCRASFDVGIEPGFGSRGLQPIRRGEITMRYMMLYKPGRESDAPATQQEMADMGQLIEEMANAGVLIATDGLQPSSKGARVRISKDGKFVVTDGPFTETKELVAGYAIVEAKSKQAAIELAKRFLTVVGEGESEIRLMHSEPAFDSESTSNAEARKELSR
jgi:putative oxidoreductase